MLAAFAGQCFMQAIPPQMHTRHLLYCTMCDPLCMLVPAVYLGSYMLAASAGPAFPEDYKHEDGGTYRGEWRGMSKEGLGVYT